MDPTTWKLYAIIAGCVFLLACLLLGGSKLRTGKFSVFGLFVGEVTTSRGATVSRTRIDGDRNTVSAKGSDATVQDSRIRGRDSKISADS